MGTDVYVVAYNALSRSREEVMSVPVARDATYEVYNIRESQIVQSTLLPSPNYSNTKNAAPYMLHFETGTVPPVGAAVFRIRMASLSPSAIQPKYEQYNCGQSIRGANNTEAEAANLSNGVIQAHFKK